MEHIVATMADGKDASAALVKAQRALIDSDVPPMRKQPRHWAAWRVIGPARDERESASSALARLCRVGSAAQSVFRLSWLARDI
jgi:hypothetical protein